MTACRFVCGVRGRCKIGLHRHGARLRCYGVLPWCCQQSLVEKQVQRVTKAVQLNKIFLSFIFWNGDLIKYEDIDSK